MFFADPECLRNPPFSAEGLVIGSPEIFEPAQVLRSFIGADVRERRFFFDQTPEQKTFSFLSIARMRIGIPGSSVKPSTDGFQVIAGRERTSRGRRPVESLFARERLGEFNLFNRANTRVARRREPA